MSDYRKGYIRAIKDMTMWIVFIVGYSYIFYKALEIILK